jgi:hypothetical protein
LANCERAHLRWPSTLAVALTFQATSLTISRSLESKMHPRTIATLGKLRQAHWFNAVGVHDTKAAEVLSSWDEAIESCGSADWENLCLEAVNQYCERLVERAPREFAKWNDIALGIKPAAMALVREKTKDIIEANQLPEVFINTVNWDIVHLCMEAEYADIYPPGFFASQSYWYVKGHFPCGWRGNFPNGKLVIY